MLSVYMKEISVGYLFFTGVLSTFEFCIASGLREMFILAENYL